jgi:hypothetical protein
MVVVWWHTIAFQFLATMAKTDSGGDLNANIGISPRKIPVSSPLSGSASPLSQSRWILFIIPRCGCSFFLAILIE